MTRLLHIRETVKRGGGPNRQKPPAGVSVVLRAYRPKILLVQGLGRRDLLPAMRWPRELRHVMIRIAISPVVNSCSHG
jgi:hypothetical protein